MAALPDRMLATTIGPAADKIVSLGENGAVGTFTFAFTAPEDARCYLALSPGRRAGFPEGHVYVSLDRDVWRLTPDGVDLQRVATLPAGAGAITGLCFDTTGDFDDALLVLASGGGVYRLEADGRFERAGFVGPGGRGPTVAPRGFGVHGGSLLVAFPERHEVKAMDASGAITRAVAWSGVSGVAAVPPVLREFGRSDGALFIAVESGDVYRFAAADFTHHPDGLVLTSALRSGSGLTVPRGEQYTSQAFSRFLGAEICAVFVQSPAVLEVPLDILPGNAGNRLTLGATDLVPVGILSTSWFRAAELDMPSQRLAGAPAVPHGRQGFGTLADLDGDGRVDLTLYFRPADMQLEPGAMTLHLEGRTMGGEAVHGADAVQVAGP